MEAVSKDGAPLAAPPTLALQTPDRLMIDSWDPDPDGARISVKSKPTLTFTQPIRDRTLALVDGGDDAALDGVYPTLARRLDTVMRTATRDGWREVLEARVFGEDPVGLTELQHDALMALDGTETVAGLASRLGDPDAERQVLRLAELSVLDLLDAPLSKPLSAQFARQRIVR
jgi:hypothetical protein